MKKFLQWGLFILSVLAGILGFLLIISETETMSAFVLSKLAGFGLCLVAYLIIRKL